MMFDIFGKITKYERERNDADAMSEMDVSGNISVKGNESDASSDDESVDESVTSSNEADDDCQLDKKGPYFRLTVLSARGSTC